MRKIVVTAVAAALVVGAFLAPAADAKKKRYKRTATGTYAAPSHGQGDVAYGCVYSAENCVQFATGAKDRYVTLKAADQTGGDVWLVVNQPDSNADGLTEHVGEGCGSTTKMAIPAPGAELIIYVPAIGSVLNNCPGPATTGTVTAVFTSK